MNEKYLGYGMLAVGLLVMVFASVQIVLAFTKQIKPIQYYSPPAETLFFQKKHLLTALI